MLDVGSPDPDAVRYLVTLVHGTHARNAPWTHDNSKLCTGLRDALGDTVCFRRFPWSGRNSAIDRAEASEALAQRIADNIEKYPSARQFVIAHSHGGNFALSAVAAAGVADRIPGVVCLATPFLVSRKRDLGKGSFDFTVGMSLIGFLASIIVVVLHPLGTSVWRLAAQGVLSLTIGMTLFVAVMRWSQYGQRIERAMAATATAIDPERVLLVRSPADEASGLLIAGQFASQITVRVYLVALRMRDRVESFVKPLEKRRRPRWASAIELIALAVFLLSHVVETNTGLPQWLRNASLVGGYSSLLALLLVLPLRLEIMRQGIIFAAELVVAALTWPIILLLSVFLMIPFGWEVAVANVLLDVSAEATPLGAWTVHTVAPLTSVDIDSDDIPLVHSAIYDNPHVIALISDWMRTRAEHWTPFGMSNLDRARR